MGSSNSGKLDLGAIWSGISSIFGSVGSSAFNAYWQKKMLEESDYRNTINWLRSLHNGPTEMRKGLEKAGYNPLLALGWQPQNISSSPSIPASLGMDLSGLGDVFTRGLEGSAKRDYMEKQGELVDAQKDLVDTQKKDLEASVNLKEKQAEKASAETTNTKVKTVTEPVNAVSHALGGAVTALGATKAIDYVKSIPKPDKLVDIPLKAAKSFGGKIVSPLSKFGLLSLPFLAGGISAYGLKKLHDNSKEGSNVRKIFNMPNLGSRLR